MGEELNLSVTANAVPLPGCALSGASRQLPQRGSLWQAPQSERFRQRLPYQGSCLRSRLRGCTKGSLTDMPMAPPLGELAGASPTERARLLTENHRRCDSIALTKSLPIAAPAPLSCRACPLRRLRRHLSQRERLWQAASFPVSFWRIICYNGFAALPAHFIREGGESNELYSIFCSVCRSKCNVVLHLQVA